MDRNKNRRDDEAHGPHGAAEIRRGFVSLSGRTAQCEDSRQLSIVICGGGTRMGLWLLASFPEWKPHFSFLANAAANELMALRWLHFIFGIIWIGLLYFFNLVGTPSMKALEPGVRVKVYPVLMSRAMAWFWWWACATFFRCWQRTRAMRGIRDWRCDGLAGGCWCGRWRMREFISCSFPP